MVPQLKGESAIFVASKSALSDRPGGVQLCTQEYRRALVHGNFHLTDVSFNADQSVLSKIRRKLSIRPYANHIPRGLVDQVVETSRTCGADIVFLNQCELMGIAKNLRSRLPNSRIIFLSHGLESVDYLHELRGRFVGIPFKGTGIRQELRLARQIVQECRQREYVDATISLTSIEAEMERWLGVRNSTWVPRIVEDATLEWCPVPGRVGFTGTLSHPPNLEGLLLLLMEMNVRGSNLRVRVVGGPASKGRELVARFSNVEYLGPLSDEQLREEAKSWQCFLHPLFCYPRGASTKLAVGLSWGIPVVTTTAGHRGYDWKEGRIPVGDSPKEFLERVREICESAPLRDQAAHECRLARDSSTKLTDSSSMICSFLRGVG